MEAAIEAARLRFRPILMTSFAFILGVVPLVIATGAGAASQNAVGLGVMGGMLAATPLAVIFVPTFFVVILRLFRSKPKLLGHQAPHIPSAEVTREGEEP
jgi:multidrug efflux pump